MAVPSSWRADLPDETSTQALGRRLGAWVRVGDVVALSGPWGAGKTTLVRGLAEGVGSSDWVMSPTFVLVRVYTGRVRLYHVDFYRLNSEEEVWDAGIEELLPGDGVTAVEWADRFPTLLPAERLELRLSFAGDGRQIEAIGWGERGTDLIRRLLAQQKPPGS